jgi:hypothetical protein
MSAEFDKILKLLDREGDKVIIHSDDRNYVLMSLESFEKIKNRSLESGFPVAELTEDQLLEKINNEIARWRESQVESENLPYFTAKDERAEDSHYRENDADEQYYLEPVD